MTSPAPLPDLHLLIEVTEGGDCMGHVPALPGLCFRAESPEQLLRNSVGEVVRYAGWLRAESLADISPHAEALIGCIEARRLSDLRVVETERRAGSPVWISGNPAVLFDADREPLPDAAVRANLRFARHVVKRMQVLMAGLTPTELARESAAGRRSPDQTLAHIGDCVWWYCSRLDDSLPEPRQVAGEDPTSRIERLLDSALEQLLRVPFTNRAEVYVPRRFSSADAHEPWTHAKTCRRQAEHVWEHLQGVARARQQADGLEAR